MSPEGRQTTGMCNQISEKKTYTVKEIASILGISEKVAYSLVKSGSFRCIRIGRAIRVSKDSFDSWLGTD